MSRMLYVVNLHISLSIANCDVFHIVRLYSAWQKNRESPLWNAADAIAIPIPKFSEVDGKV